MGPPSLAPALPCGTPPCHTSACRPVRSATPHPVPFYLVPPDWNLIPSDRFHLIDSIASAHTPLDTWGARTCLILLHTTTHYYIRPRTCLILLGRILVAYYYILEPYYCKRLQTTAYYHILFHLESSVKIVPPPWMRATLTTYPRRLLPGQAPPFLLCFPSWDDGEYFC